ncbi:hypothetical protein ACFWR6_06505 [Streptomyces griseus]|uniref:hypothetical protein n=1 Tax=Streptomyces griseus TaxID=1911 RepID=UPI00365EAF51
MTKEPTEIRVVSLSFGLGGVRIRADGRTGWAAWRILRRDHPRVARAAAVYLVTVVSLLVVIVTAAVLGGAQ